VILSGWQKAGTGSGVGVRNVHERIGLYYGREYGLTFQSEIEEGTIVTITFPARLAGEDMDEQKEETNR
jgi:two-component system sensor histidine kinase YesM